MPTIPALTTFTANTLAKAAEVNSNFGTIRTTLNTYGLFADVAASISAVHTYSATPVYTAGATFTTAAPTFSAGLTVSGGGASVAGGLTVSSGGAAITGNSTVTGNLTVSGTLSGTLSGSIAASNVTSGTFPGTYSFTNAPTFLSGLSASSASVTLGLSSGARSSAVDWTGSIDVTLVTSYNIFRARLTGNTTATFSLSSAVSTFTLLYVAQDGAGGRTLSWSGLTWPGGTPPTQTSTAGRGDLYLIVQLDSTTRMAVRLAADLAL